MPAAMTWRAATAGRGGSCRIREVHQRERARVDHDRDVGDPAADDGEHEDRERSAVLAPGKHSRTTVDEYRPPASCAPAATVVAPSLTTTPSAVSTVSLTSGSSTCSNASKSPRRAAARNAWTTLRCSGPATGARSVTRAFLRARDASILVASVGS